MFANYRKIINFVASFFFYVTTKKNRPPCNFKSFTFLQGWKVKAFRENFRYLENGKKVHATFYFLFKIATKYTLTSNTSFYGIGEILIGGLCIL